jgi:GNAT superfamily N-acetyltransferase
VPDELVAVEFRVEDHPDPADLEVLETQIRREASAAMGLGDEADLAIFVRDAGRVVAGISGWTWGDCCELQSLWVAPSLRGRGLATRLIAAAEAAAAARGLARFPLPPPPTLSRRRAGARRPSTSPTPSRPGLSMSRPATNWWVASRTSHQERMSSGTASA